MRWASRRECAGFSGEGALGGLVYADGSGLGQWGSQGTREWVFLMEIVSEDVGIGDGKAGW